jgi:uncharacterized protein YegP (UPF0339 family)
MGKFTIKTTLNNGFIFNLKSDSGQTIFTSEMFRTKEEWVNGIVYVQKNCTYYNRYEFFLPLIKNTSSI